MKVRLWCLLLGMSLMSPLVGGLDAIIAQGDNSSLASTTVAQTDSNSENCYFFSILIIKCDRSS